MVGGIEALFLSAFMISFVSYFARGISTLSYVEIYILNGIVGILLIAAVLALFFAAPAGDDPDREKEIIRLAALGSVGQPA